MRRWLIVASFCDGAMLILVLTYGTNTGTSQANGDVRAVGEIGSGGVSGRLDIYLREAWGTICSEGFNQYAANAACRELGFANATKWGKASEMGFPQANESTKIWLSNVQCPVVSNPDTEGQWHILRCSHSDIGEVPQECNHDDDVGVICGNITTYSYPYGTQVWVKNIEESIKGITPSQGQLNVYINSNWSVACYSGFTQPAADSACRQLGFTNASFIPASSSPNDVIWLKNFTCQSSSNCLNDCFQYPSEDDLISVCSEGEDVVIINCTFDLAAAETLSAGTNSACNYSPGISVPILTIVAVVITLFILLLLVATIFVLVVACCFMTSCPTYFKKWKSDYNVIV